MPIPTHHLGSVNEYTAAMNGMNETNGLATSTTPVLVLRHPTELEKEQTWTKNCENWGKALGLSAYLDRERCKLLLASTPSMAVTLTLFSLDHCAIELRWRTYSLDSGRRIPS